MAPLCSVSASGRERAAGLPRRLPGSMGCAHGDAGEEVRQHGDSGQHRAQASHTLTDTDCHTVRHMCL